MAANGTATNFLTRLAEAQIWFSLNDKLLDGYAARQF